MSLNSFNFIICFAILLFVLALLQLFRERNKNIVKAQLIIILCFSYYFIMKTDWRFCICIALVTVITFVIAKLISTASSKKWLIIGIIVLVSILAYFKYTNFFVNSFRSLMGEDGIALNIILPLGISFYIFGAISYLIDVYRKDIALENNILDFALYMALFTKITAGPIVRAKDFLPQTKDYRGVEWGSFLEGIQIFVFGFFKKIVLADHLNVFVNDVFFAPTAYDTGTVILAAISYSLQIYFDFSGYSDMAIGISKIIGFDLKANFNLPYFAKNVSDFWKRWHISLSSWFQDYLYIPLGGSRKGNSRTYFNLMAVMLVSGLWHGAGWTFVVWGGLHGISSCIVKAFNEKLNKLGNVLNIIITFFFVTLFWVVFRADSFQNAIDIWKGMFTIHTGISQPYTWSFFAIVCLVGGTIAAYKHSKKIGDFDKMGNLYVKGYYPVLNLNKIWAQVVFFTFCGIAIIMGYYGNTAFIYGAF